MKINFTRTNGPLDEIIDRLMDTAGGIRRPEFVREMIIASLKAGQEDDEGADIKLMNSTLKEMRFTSKVFGPYRKVRKVTVFGSARVKAGEALYEMARLLGEKLAGAGYMVITGGGGGIMEAVNEGAGPEHSFGVNIRLPFEEKPNPVIEGNPRAINYKYFFNRKVAFIKEADAVALFPGGFGTLDEAMETLTLLQTGKRNPMPLVLVDQPGGTYWNSVIRFLEDELLARHFICPSDFALIERVGSAQSALEAIQRFYRRYHSIRYVRGRLVIRLTTSPRPEEVQALADRFRDILLPGGEIVLTGALDEEVEDGDVIDLPRLVVDFNRRDFGRLRSLIDAINDFQP